MSRPSAWETTTLGEACEKPQYGFTASAETRDTGTRFLRITDLREGDLNWSEVPFCKCLEKEIDRYQLKTGDLVVARIGATTGRTSLAFSPPKAVFASYLIRLRPKADINPFFLYFFTQSSAYWSAINSSKDSNLKGGVNAGVLTRIEMPKPSRCCAASSPTVCAANLSKESSSAKSLKIGTSNYLANVRTSKRA